MRKGGGHHKGSAWERETGRLLSLWLTRNERPDIFGRNVLSGGSFTLAEAKGLRSSRMPGDLIMAHPLAFRFLKHYSIECKHLRSIGLLQYFFDPKALTPLGHIIALAQRQAASIDIEYMVIAKENRRAPLVFVSGETGRKLLASIRKRRRAKVMPMYHRLHKERIFVMRLIDLINHIDPDVFLGDVEP